jgi:hypothetical protein
MVPDLMSHTRYTLVSSTDVGGCQTLNKLIMMRMRSYLVVGRASKTYLEY